jgi:uncharacterized Zn-binding protein involved in type VI secretion
MSDAARVGDPTGHPGVITGPGVATVLIGGMPAAVAGDTHTCSYPDTTNPHPPTPLTQGSSSVLIGGQPAARVGDMAGCGAPILAGASTVLIGG